MLVSDANAAPVLWLGTIRVFIGLAILSGAGNRATPTIKA
jgi:hypothetical protein